MSAESVRALFDKRRAEPFEPMLVGVTGSYRFDIRGVGSFFVAVDDGHLTVGEGARDADCVVTCDEADFLAIADGRLNLLTGGMQGLVDVRGDLALAQKLHGPMPRQPPEARP